jgi:multiple sugar transport system permease protein
MRAQKNAIRGWSFLAPAFAHLLAFALIPMGYAFYISLSKINLFRGESKYVGFDNYTRAVQEDSFWSALWNSFRYAAMSVPAGIAVALLVAILVNQKLKGMTIYRTVFYVPAIASGIATAMLWIYIFLPDSGLINMTLQIVQKVIQPGVAKDQAWNINFLNQSEWAMPALAFMSIWTGLGPRMVLFIAGLIGIPAPLYEAAQLDGATSWRCFWKITVPMLTPTTLFVVITSTIGAMQVFTPVYLMTKGGPEYSTDVIGYHIYTEAWVNFNTGLASAKSFILLAIIAIISLFQWKLMESRMDSTSA